MKYIRRIQYKILQWYLRKKGVEIGKNTFISLKAHVDHHKGAKVTIGDNCFITRNVVILNHTDTGLGGPCHLYVAYGGGRISKDVTIGNNVFIGVNSVVLPGITIGDNSIIGALSLVNRDVPPNSVYAGIPIRRRQSLPEFLAKASPGFKIDRWERDFQTNDD